MKSSRLWLFIVILLFAVIVVLSWVLFTTPRAAANPPLSATSTPSGATQPAPAASSAPLSARVSLASPQSGESVGHTFDIAGKAPGQWFFEAQFPIQVRDPQDNIVGRATGSAQGDWQTTNLVAFKATMHADDSYHGPATLILMKDNPSGLPENDDSVEIPIVVD